MNRTSTVTVALAGSLLVAAMTGTMTPAQAQEAKPIVIGSTLPLTGPLQTLGALVREANQQAIADVNAAGGVQVGGAKRRIEYRILDNKSDPNLVTQQARSLVLEQGAVGLLGSFTPPLSIPLSNVAEQLQVPAVFTNTPVEAWQSANPRGWKYAWDVFVSETQMTRLHLEAGKLAGTNKRVALFTDTEDDGVVFGQLWEKHAPQQGFQVVYRAKFPIGTTDFNPFIQRAKAADADLVFAIMIPPDGIALWKQMKALGYAPKMAACEKCAHTVFWPKTLGDLAEGTMMFGWWSPEANHPGTDRVMKLWGDKYGMTTDLETLATNYATANLLIDAIRRAASAEPKAINAALAATDARTVVGPVRFERNAHVVPAFLRQWQGSTQARVVPADASAARLVAPLPGFAK